MRLDAERLTQQIPYYLTAEDKRVLLNELEAISRGGTAEFVLSPREDAFREMMLPGDGWRGFQLFLFGSDTRISVRGLVLSNSCDVDPNNSRESPTRVIFAPLVKLAAYRDLLEASGIDPARVVNKIEAIKAQKTTSVFYLPAGKILHEDYIVRFDEVQSMPLTAHATCSDRDKLFTLSNTGFYMLVFKLSVHFCRLQEKISRNR